MENKKIKGTISVEFNSIKFKSKLEKSCYIKLVDAGFNTLYEPVKFVIWDGVKLDPSVQAFLPGKINKKEVVPSTRSLRNITYTPDFLVVIGNIISYFDAKGYANDRYPMKKKMFLSHLNNLSKANVSLKYNFFEVQTISQILHTIQIIKRMHQLDKINALVQELLPKDRNLGEQFIVNRDFKSLWDLVHSCIVRVKRNTRKEFPDSKYQSLNIEKVQSLEAEVSNYLSLIDPHWLDDRDEISDEMCLNEEY